MGDVWLARHKQTNDGVVIKVMHGHLPPNAIDRLRPEAQALQKINHPNVVRVLGCGGTTDQRPFLVLEYLSGKPLDGTRLFSQAEAVRLVGDLLGALSAVHEADMVHRDVNTSG